MKNTNGLKIIALIFPGICLVILLLFAMGETVGGDWSGLAPFLIIIAPLFISGIFLLGAAGVEQKAV